jgi:8-oxo-dGTP pyrophosphatase MutT (NUDIX family)
VNITFVSTTDILDLPLNIPVKQVYIWIVSKDNKYLLVSKDGVKFQQVGGHPEFDESIYQTLKREVKEESGIDLSVEELYKVKFLGYYRIKNDSQGEFLQLRFVLNYSKFSYQVELAPKEEDSEAEQDKVKVAKFLSEDEAFNGIVWLKDSVEYRALLNLLNA